MYCGYIYKITNLKNGKIYVGKREKPTFDANYWGSGKYLLNAINKYGKENFNRDVLEWCTTKEELHEREKYWIEKLDALSESVGYNLVPGGRGGSAFGKHNGAFNKHWYTDGNSQILCYEEDAPEGWVRGYSQSRKDKTSRINKGKKFSEEHKNKIRQSLKMNPPLGMKGKKHSDDWKEMMSNTHKGKTLSSETRFKISNSLKEYYTIHESGNKGKVVSEETRLKMSQSHRGKTHPTISLEARKAISEKNKQHYLCKILVNDGIKCYHINPSELDYYISNGYKMGKINKHGNTPNKGKICINNGINNKYIYKDELEYYLNNGWLKGGLKRNALDGAGCKELAEEYGDIGENVF